MRNLTYYPFKKNRYFSGKLLTAEDFEQEQQYMDDKRRMVNRWVIGTGIVAGLEIIQVDDYSISVEMGMALDYTGREIVVDSPVIRKLSLIDGYEEATAAEGKESMYLCIEYEAVPIEAVHNINNRAVHTEEEETFNKYREGYHLYVTDEEPPEPETGAEPGEDIRRVIYDRAEQIHQQSYQRGIYLSRIELVKAGDFFMIERVMPLMPGQYIYSQPLLAGYLKDLQSQWETRRPSEKTEPEKEKTSGNRTLHQGSMDSDWQFQQGTAVIPLKTGARSGHCCFSEEIPHGLGLGDVELMLHVIQGNYTCSGAEGIFPEEEQVAEAAARLNRNTGTFVVGIRLLEDLEETEVSVGWTAIRKRSRNEIKENEPRIYLSPGIVNLKLREEITLKAVCVNMETGELVWSVETKEGGTVSQDGVYHAPNQPGVYEVSCSSIQGQARASVFIVVQE